MTKNNSGKKNYTQGKQTASRNAQENQNNLMLPGVKPVLEFLRDNPKNIDTVFIRKGKKDALTSEIIDLCRAAGVRFSLLDSESFARYYSGSSQGVVARLFAAGFSSLEEVADAALKAPLPVIVALDQVQDPGNAGTIVRTLYALGGGGLILPKHQGAYLGDAAAKSSAGAMQKLPVAKVTNLAQSLDKLEEMGFTIYGAATGDNAENVYTFSPNFPAVLVLGSEEEGIRQGVAKRCAGLLSIPMPRDFDSLNVAQAGAIILGFFSAAKMKL
ncbi:23S rRNA (guanosine(2251)-2'-O)-methyltransferase RlmB [Desulfovibrio sp. OttesenSCG-928-F07]|nr:23S rRNA (guanosine(2251)-2'-O)-methyltransferase RlmB [Desulfovibrio sp. OttesenSCG-928-F07]